MTDAATLRTDIRQWLRVRSPDREVEVTVVGVDVGPAFERRRITYDAHGDAISAFLLVPAGLRGPAPAVVVHHQHNGERHLGKSEVCGLAGDPLQAFAPALAENGIIVLAPDAICFEDRRKGGIGTEPRPDDWEQHYNEVAYRLIRGDTLMRKVLEDAEAAVSALAGMPTVDPSKIGILGHSYGGNTVLFQTALDERVRYACASGAVCSYRDKMAHATGIEMAEVIPGVLDRFDIDLLLKLAAPRPVLVISASDDKYSRDADEVVQSASSTYRDAGSPTRLQHARYQGGHALTRERFESIVGWMTSTAFERAAG